MLTANWKSYNETFFKINLPSSWTREQAFSAGNLFKSFINYDQKTAPEQGFDPLISKGLLSLDITIDMTTKDFQKYILQVKQDHLRVYPTETWNETSIRLDNHPAIKIKDNYGYRIFVQPPTNKAIIMVKFGLDFDNYQSLAEQILSTLKVTDRH